MYISFYGIVCELLVCVMYQLWSWYVICACVMCRRDGGMFLVVVRGRFWSGRGMYSKNIRRQTIKGAADPPGVFMEMSRYVTWSDQEIETMMSRSMWENIRAQHRPWVRKSPFQM